MKVTQPIGRSGWAQFVLIVLLFTLVLLAQPARAFNLSVVGPNGEAVTKYRWTLEEDRMYKVSPGVIDPNTVSVTFHPSYMPVVASGTQATIGALTLDPLKHYYISVLPEDTDIEGNRLYTNGGAQIAPGALSATAYCNRLPIPTAQITVFVFEDTQPINNAPDLPEEQGLEGFQIILEEPAGRFGASGGQVTMDAYGNPLGTTYALDIYGNVEVNPDGSPQQVLQLGTGFLMTGPDGTARIKYISPGKYGVIIVPPAGLGWQQTSTIEGTVVNDAWVKANEPPYFQEFGPPGYHVFFGFVRPFRDNSVLNTGNTLSGRIVNMHMSRPPDYTMHNGEPFDYTTPWVGLNDFTGGIPGRGLFVGPVNPDGTFSIPNIPSGSYQLVVFDNNLDLIFSFLTVNMAGADIALGDVPCFMWFTRLHNRVFFDHNGNGFPDCVTPNCDNPLLDDVGMMEVPVNLRWRDGTIYNSMPTDTEGWSPFDEVFPFFSWLVAEVDFARYKATGVTITVDAGGAVNAADPWSFDGKLTPQLQPDNGNLPYRTETGPVLTQGFQGFIGQTSVLQWGKQSYGPGENGGISGVVLYASTRAENDPRYAAADTWEPGIPRVQISLYQDANQDQVIDDLNGDLAVTLADVDNAPLGDFPGPGDIDRDGNGVFNAGDAINVTHTDSWDDNLPTGCVGDIFYHHGVATDCYDGLRNFNQVRPAVFDGGYAFASYFPGGVDSGSTEVDGLPSGVYIVETAVPPGYELVKEEDRNVDFGDNYVPSPEVVPPILVGDPHLVPPYLTLFPDAQIPAPYAGQWRLLGDRKQVMLNEGKNAACDFFLFTAAPISGHIHGFILDDTQNEFDPNSPNFGEKYAPPWLPVAIKDWTGRVIGRTYSDEWGVYEALVPSTYTANRPMPSGYAPNMITVSLNDPGPILDTRPGSPTFGQMIEDPFFNRKYSQFTYTFQYMPGTTTYLDTPVVPTGAFTGGNQYPLDCELPDGTPKIYSVNGPSGGPYVVATNRVITITAEGQTEVPNPLYDGPNGTLAPTVFRDYGFGTTPGTVTINGVALTDVAWSAGAITGTVAAGTTTGQLVVTRGDNGLSSPIGVTMTVGGSGPIYVNPALPANNPLRTIQGAIDSASPGDLILVPPGLYDELVIVYEPIRLQGYGAGSTRINAVKTPAEKLNVWRQKVTNLVNAGTVDLLPNQPVGGGFPEPGLLNSEEGPGIIVLARDGDFQASPHARIDGFSVFGGDTGGGIFINGYVRYLEISNNRIVNNQGFWSGGIRAGFPDLAIDGPNGLEYVDCNNDSLHIHHNHISQNGGLGGAGGGISLYTGCDNYRVTDNFICGNFSMGDGGGLGHQGKSTGGQIVGNVFQFNQTFNQGQPVAGGGVFIGGGAPLVLGQLSPGAGNVTINRNLFQGNLAGAGDGGAIRLARVNGMDVSSSPNTPGNWYWVNIFNNFIENNVAGMAGGGISLQDSTRVRIIHNTIAHNDSTATAGEAFTNGPNDSIPQPAGVVGRVHSPDFANAFGLSGAVSTYRDFSNPVLANNIIWENRSFYFSSTALPAPPFFGLLPDPLTPVFWDLQVVGFAGSLNPRYCLLTSTAGYSGTNISGDPVFLTQYFNSASNYIAQQEITNGLQIQPAFDEGGNFIDVRFGPLSPINPVDGLLFGDPHLNVGSPALGAGDGSYVLTYGELGMDFDTEPRESTSPDIGADQYTTGGVITDLNLDGVINASDLAILINYLNGNLPQGPAPFLAPLSWADFNGDLVVDSQDVLLLAQYLGGMGV